MTIYKTYKFRMYPSDEQRNLLNNFLGSSRFIYNYFLKEKETRYKDGYNYFLKKMLLDLVPLQVEYPWLKNVDSCILRTSLFDLDDAYTRYFNKQCEKPRHKKKSFSNSYRTTCIRSTYKGHNYANIKVDLDSKTIKLPKLSEIKIRGYRNLKSFDNKKILNATVSKVANKYYVSVCVEEQIEVKEFILKNCVGIDVGIKNIVITSDGLKYNAMAKITKIEKRIKGLQKGLSRTQRGSKNRYKIITKIQRAYEKLRNMRKYYIHLITKEIVRDNDLIVTENLKVKDMITNGNKGLRKLLPNTSLSEISRQLEYKSKWQNKKLIKVNTYYASSQLCSCCGYQNKQVKDLKIRKWTCPKCNHEHDRDINASMNILYEGITKYFKEQYKN